jgi:hypothetical protein
LGSGRKSALDEDRISRMAVEGMRLLPSLRILLARRARFHRQDRLSARSFLSRREGCFPPVPGPPIERNVWCEVPEWDGREARSLEEDAALMGDGWHCIDGRQEDLCLIY